MTTNFEIGKTYKTSASASNLMMQTACNVIDRTKDTITIVEEYEEMPVTIQVKKMMDRYGNRFEWAKYLGDNLFSY